jgi:NADH-quinone oxidoreductase subunit J
MESLLFWFFTFGMLLGGVGVIANRNPIASALSLVISISFLAGLYLLLNAFFLAAIQIIVYAGAVMVLFLFIIMLWI